MNKEKTDLKAMLEQMEYEMAKALLDQIKSGRASGNTFNAARLFMQGHGVFDDTDRVSPLEALGEILPWRDPLTQSPLEDDEQDRSAG